MILSPFSKKSTKKRSNNNSAAADDAKKDHDSNNNKGKTTPDASLSATNQAQKIPSSSTTNPATSHKQMTTSPSSISPSLCHCICLATFNIKKGTTLSHKYPSHHHLPTVERSLPDLVIPDGAHIFEEDSSYLFFVEDAIRKTHEVSSKEEEQESQTHITTTETPKRPLYALVQYKSKRCSTASRGAIQKSLVLFSYEPRLFSLYQRICKLGLDRILQMDNGNGSSDSLLTIPQVLETIYNSLNIKALQKNLTIHIWNHSIPVRMPPSVQLPVTDSQTTASSLPALYEDRFGPEVTKSLKELCLVMRRDVMVLWYSVLLQRRVLLVGTPAKRVGQCVMALPLLVSPMRGFTPQMSPYVCLSDISSPLMQQSSFYVGSTNHLMEIKPQWWDYCASFSKEKVLLGTNASAIKLTSSDREHIQNVLSGIKDGKSDQWVADQFEAYTLQFLCKLRSAKKKIKNKVHQQIKTTPLYQRWEKDWEAFDGDVTGVGMMTTGRSPSTPTSPLARGAASSLQQVSPVDLLKDLRENIEEMPILDRVKKTYELSKRLSNLTHIDNLCDQGAVDVIAAWLEDSNSQIRKYSAQLLSQLVLSVKGQKALVSNEEALDRILTLMDDSMPNVRVASFYCLMKLSSIEQGRRLILEKNGSEILSHRLMESVSDKMNDVKIYSARTLRNFYHNIPMVEDEEETLQESTETLLPRPSSSQLSQFLNVLQETADKVLKAHLLLLLDQWNLVDLRGKIPITEKHAKLFSTFLGTSNDAVEDCIEVTQALLAQIASESHAGHSTIVLEMAEFEGLVGRLFENEHHSRDLELRTASSLLMLRLASQSKYVANCIASHCLKQGDAGNSSASRMTSWINFVIKRQKSNEHTGNILKLLKVLLNVRRKDYQAVQIFCHAKGVHALQGFIERQCKDASMNKLVLLCVSVLKEVLQVVALQKDMNTYSRIKEPIEKLKNLPLDGVQEEDSTNIDLEEEDNDDSQDESSSTTNQEATSVEYQEELQQRLTSCLSEVLKLE